MFLKRVLIRLKSGVLHVVQVIFRKNGFPPGTLPGKDYKKDKVNGELVHDRRFKGLSLYSIIN